MPSLENLKKKNDRHSETNLNKTLLKKDHLENTVFYLIITIIFLAAIPFGSVDLWAKSIIVLLICIAAILRVVSVFFEGEPLFNNGTLIFPLAGLLGIAIIQIIPWSSNSIDNESTISLDPVSTKNFILIFSGIIIATEILLAYTTTYKRLKTLIYLVLTVGVISALVGVLGVYLLTDRQSGISAYINVGTGFAQFLNRNHFLYLMEMTIGLLLGFLFKGNLADKYKFWGWVLTALLLLLSITVNSRGGIISLTVIFILAFTIHLLTRHKRTKYEDLEPSKARNVLNIVRKALLVTILGGVVFGTIAVIIVFVGGDRVITRIESIQDEVEHNDEKKLNRMAIWKSTWELIKERPVMGVGFGGYAAAITKFDNSNGKFSLQEAHNDYLEILANGGIISFLLLIIFVYLFITKTTKQFQSRNILRRASCFGAILGIIGIGIHSLVEFGLQTLINALLFMVLVVIATANIPSSEKYLHQVSEKNRE